jgi:hypothetical protein
MAGEDGEKIIPMHSSCGLFIRDYIYFNGPASAWELYKAWKEVRKLLGRRGPSYTNFWSNYIWPLKKLGLLIEVGRGEPTYEDTVPPVLLDVDRSRLTDPAWWQPKKALYGEAPDYPAPEPVIPTFVEEEGAPAKEEVVEAGEEDVVAKILEEFERARARGLEKVEVKKEAKKKRTGRGRGKRRAKGRRRSSKRGRRRA